MKKWLLLLLIGIAFVTSGFTVLPGRAVREEAYGVRWDTSSSSSTLTAGKLSGGVFSAQAVTTWPIQEAMKRVVLTHNTGAVNYYLCSTDSTLKADCSTAATLTGADGQVMVEVPAFYYLIFTDGNYKYFMISSGAFSQKDSGEAWHDAVLHPWFQEGGGSASYKYVSAFEGVLKRSGAYVDGTGAQTGTVGDLIHSVYGYKPLGYFHRAERRTYSVDGNFNQLGYWANEALILLFITEYATWASQTSLPGYTEDAAFSWSVDVNKTGITVPLGNASGSILWQNAIVALRCSEDQTGLYVANSYRGVENIFGHFWKHVDGINIEFIGAPLTDAEVYVCNNPAQWADNTTTNYTDLVIDLPLADGFQTNLHNGTLLVSSASGGSSGTYIQDDYWAGAVGWRTLRQGGATVTGADAGIALRSVYNSRYDRHTSVGGRTTR